MSRLYEMMKKGKANMKNWKVGRKNLIANIVTILVGAMIVYQKIFWKKGDVE